MNIALDFDDTYTADPSLWNSFLETASQQGHMVWMVTARRDNEQNRDFIRKSLGFHFQFVTLIFANLKSKLKHCESIGLKINIWIDDSPYAIIHDM